VRPIAEVNDDAGLVTNEDETLIIRSRTLLANDVDGDRLEISQVKDAVGGTVSLSSNGDITFTPTANYNGLAGFRYVANTPEGGRGEAWVALTIAPVNDTPVANSNSNLGLSTDEGIAFTISAATLALALANDTDIDGHTLQIVGVAGTANLAAQWQEDGSVILTPVGDFFGNTSFTYQVSDGHGGFASASISVLVRPVNDAPVTAADHLTTSEDIPLFFSGDLLTGNDYDPDGEPLNIVSVSIDTGGGSIELFENDTIRYTPGANFNGTAAFFYTLNDGQGGTTTQRVTVAVSAVNDKPNAVNNRARGLNAQSALIGYEGSVLVIDPAILLANDTDIDDPDNSLEIDTVSFADHGTVELGTDGLIRYTPDAGFWGTASFSYVISDPHGAVDDATVDVYFRPTGNVAPQAGWDSFTGTEDTPIVITRAQLLASAFDPNDDTLSIVGSFFSIGGAPFRAQTWYFNELGDLVIVPKPNVTGEVTLYYNVSDGSLTDRGRIDVTFNATPDTPTALDDTGISSGAERPLVLRISDLLANDYDIDVSNFTANAGWSHKYGASNLVLDDIFNLPSGATHSIYDDQFIVIEFAPEVTGALGFDYSVDDPTGRTDTGHVSATIRTERDATITGTSKRDLLIGSAEGETLVGLGGIDDLFGREGDDILRGGDGADLLDGGDGFDIADFSDSNVGLRMDILARIGQGGYAEGDELESIEGLIGSSKADQLYGTLTANLLEGRGGGDALYGRDGDDTLLGGDGDDFIEGGLGVDEIDGGAGIDTANYSDATGGVGVSLATGLGTGGEADGDTLDGIENLIGSLHADTLEGDDGANFIDGGREDDILRGGGGDDWIVGGRDGDTIEGGAGIDTADYSISATAVSIDLAAGTASGGDAEGDTLTGIENLVGSGHADTLLGDAGDNVIAGGNGADTIDGRGGRDVLDFSDADGAVTVDLGAGTGTQGEANGDTIANIEDIRGSLYADTITGDTGNNLLDGNRGDDDLAGGAGSDTYILGDRTGEDTILEGALTGDVDVLRIVNGYTPETVSLYYDGDDLIVELEMDQGFGVDSVRITDHFLGGGIGIDSIVFDDGTTWDRTTIDAMAALTRFQAEDDVVRWADEDQPFTFESAVLMVNDTGDPEATLTVFDVIDVSGGTATLNPNGTITFDGAPDFNGSAYFDYKVTDGNGRVSTGRVEVEIRPANDAPVAANDSSAVYILDEDELFNIPEAWLLDNDFDVDGDTLTIDSFSTSASDHGTASSFEGGYVTFRPDDDYYGSAGFSYRVSDGEGGYDWAHVTLTVRPVNDAPRVVDDARTVRSGQEIVIQVSSLMGNDYDPESNAFTFNGLGEVTNGTAELDTVSGQQVIRFISDPGFVGAASFTYSIIETATGLTDSGTVAVTVLYPNDPPVAEGESFDAVEDTPLVITQAELLANDTDPNDDELVVSRLDEFPEHGSVAFDEDGNIVFTPAANYNGPASFYYWISDGEFERQATVTIDVAPTNDAPVAVDDTGLEADEDSVIMLLAADLFANDSDPEGDVLEFHDFTTNVGTIVRDGINLKLTPPANFTGTITVRYRARDDKGAVSADWADVTVLVTNLPDRPTAGTDNLSTTEDTPLTVNVSALLANDTDADGNTIRISAVGNATHGTVSLVDGVVTFTPSADFAGTAGFDYTVTDDDAGPTTGHVVVVVTPVNDAPRPQSDVLTTDEDVALQLAPSALLANDIDPDGNTIRIVAVEAITEGASATLLPNGTVVLTPPANVFGLVTFEYTIADSLDVETTSTVSVFVASVNDAPDVADEGPVELDEDQILLFAIEDLLANDDDVDGDELDFSLGTATGGTATIQGDYVRFVPTANYNGPASVAYTVSDGNGGSASGSLAIDILPVNNAPVAGDAIDDVHVNEDEAFEFALDADAFDDIDGDDLTLTATLANGSALPAWIEFEDGTFTGTPPQDFHGSIELLVTASDGTLTAEQGFTLVVDAVNDAPVANETLDDIHVNEDEAFEFALDADAFDDIDGDDLTLTARLANGSALPAWIEFEDGTFTGTPPQDFHGSIELLITASDGTLTAEQEFTLVVHPVNDAPVAGETLEDVHVDEDEAFEFALDPAAFDDIDGDDLTLTATLANGSALPAWLEFEDGTFTGTPPSNFNGSIELRVTASDGTLSASHEFTLVVDPVNDAPTATGSLPNRDLAIGAAFSFGITGVTFADVEGTSLTITATLANGDPLPSWLTFNGTTFSGTAPNSDTGDLSIVVHASDGSLEATAGFTLGLAYNVIMGTSGNNSLPGTAGADHIQGLAGNDIISPGAGADLVDGGTHTTYDTVSYMNSTSAVTLSLATGGTGGDAAGDTYIAIEYVIGTNYADWIEGSQFADTLSGLSGNDTLVGGAGDDDLRGGEGSDSLYGGDGNDIISGEGGDLIYGEAGNDQLTGRQGDYIEGGDGTDGISIMGNNVTALGGAGDDSFNIMSTGYAQIAVNGGDGLDTLNLPAGWDASFASIANFERFSGSTNSSNTGAMTFEGTSLDLSSAQFRNHLDIIAGTNSDTTIIGPSIMYGNGTDNRLRLFGAGGNDSLTASSFADHLFGNDGNDLLYGLGANDELTGGAGDDRLYGGTGDDKLFGGDGWDEFYNEAGADLFVGEGTATLSNIGSVVSPGVGYDPMTTDTVYFTGALTDYSLTWLGNNWFRVQRVAGGPAETDYVVNIGEIGFDPGTGPEDIVFLSLAPPAASAEEIVAALTEDTAFAVEIESDWFVDPNGETPTYSLADANGGAAPAWLSIVDGEIVGTPPANFAGEVEIRVLATTWTGVATKTITLDVAAVNDAPTVQGSLPDVDFDAGEAFSFGITGATFGDVDGTLTITATLANGSALPAWLSFNGTTFSGTAPIGYPQDLEITVHASDGTLEASAGFVLTHGTAYNHIVGTASNNNLSGTSGPDHFEGLGGDDTLFGGAGADLIDGGASSDHVTYLNAPSGVTLSLVTGGTGGDAAGDIFISIERITGSNHADWIEGSQFDDHISGVGGNDTIIGGSGNDNLQGDHGTDIIYGGDGNDTIRDGWDDGAADQIYGEGGNDVLRGGLDDLIDGGAGDDAIEIIGAATVYGGAGNDEIEIEGSNGTIHGGMGDDKFIVTNGMTGLTVSGGDDYDSLELRFGQDASFVSLTGIEWIHAGGSQSDRSTITLEGTTLDLSAALFVLYIDIFAGTNADTTIIGPAHVEGTNNGEVRIYGAGGNDSLTGTAHYDKLFGNAGNDQLFGLAGNDQLTGGAGDDRLFGGKGWDLFYNDAGNDLFVGEGTATLDDIGTVVSTNTPGYDPFAADTVFFTGALEDYDITVLANGWFRVEREVNGVTETDHVVNVGEIAFDPGTGAQNIEYYSLEAPVTSSEEVVLELVDETPFAFAIDLDWFEDANGLTPTYSLADANGGAAPAWLSIVDGEIVGTPPVAFEELDIQVLGTTLSGTAIKVVTLAMGPINDAPTVEGTLPDLEVEVDEAFSFGIESITFDDVDGDNLTITATLANGGALPAWLTFDGETFSGTAPGPYPENLEITVHASDGLLEATASFTLSFDIVHNSITGTESNETLNGTAVPDHIHGLGGADTIRPGAGADIIDGGSGSDIVDYYQSPTGVTLSLVTGGTAGHAAGDTYVSIERVDGTQYADWIQGSSLDDQIRASGGNDTLIGGAGNDDLRGGSGADIMTGGDGDDLISHSDDYLDGAVDQIYGGNGNDTLKGGLGDIIDGGDGNDDIEVKGSNMTVNAGEGVDIITINTGISGLVIEGGIGTYANGTNQQDRLSMASGQDANFTSITGIETIYGSTNSSNTATITIAGTNMDLSGAIFRNYLDIVAGTNSDTTILGPSGISSQTAFLRIYGAGGNDSLTTSSHHDKLYGNAGNDQLFGLRGNDELTGGTGNDTINGGGGTDTAFFAGVMSTYTVSTSGGVVSVVDNDTGADGNDGTDTIVTIETLSFKNGETMSVSSPIILDLGGDGLTTLSAEESDALFDLDGDGLGDDTSWIASGEGFLFLDRDGNGTLSDVGEISFIDDLEGATTDLEGLRAFDSNGDGLLNSTDEAFADFGIWRDIDGDGVVDDGETGSLAEFGLASFDLGGTAIERDSELGEVILINQAAYTRTDGSAGQFYDAALTFFSGEAYATTQALDGGSGEGFGPFSQEWQTWFDRLPDRAAARLSDLFDQLRNSGFLPPHGSLQGDYPAGHHDRWPVRRLREDDGIADALAGNSGGGLAAMLELGSRMLDPSKGVQEHSRVKVEKGARGPDALHVILQDMAAFGAQAGVEGLALQEQYGRMIDWNA
jgi:Ca2+-binding RTX toxin-like protein